MPQTAVIEARVMSKESKILLAHPGTQYSHQLARQLVRNELLYQFWTGFALSANSRVTHMMRRLVPNSLSRKVTNRIVHDVPRKVLRTLPLVEWRALQKIKRGISEQQVFLERNKVFQERIPSTSLRDAAAVIGFDTSSWLLAARAQEIGRPFFLDQSISHPLTNDSILQDVGRRFPHWRNGFEPRLPQLLEHEKQEYELAKRIVVASSFTKRTLVSHGVKADKILVNPYGVDLQSFHPSTLPREATPFRFLFLGSISARKGVPLLIEAWRSLSLTQSELWLVGPVSTQTRKLIPDVPGLKLVGKLPHEELPRLMRQCDALVFPSYCEGFGLVLLEALASGLPIITTEATAGPDLITDGVEGRLVRSGDLEELCEAMRWFVESPTEIQKMSVAARQCAERFSWDAYIAGKTF
jgi:glycosyltransferase involved in cell wall biosynthesis